METNKLTPADKSGQYWVGTAIVNFDFLQRIYAGKAPIFASASLFFLIPPQYSYLFPITLSPIIRSPFWVAPLIPFDPLFPFNKNPIRTWRIKLSYLRNFIVQYSTVFVDFCGILEQLLRSYKNCVRRFSSLYLL